MANRINAPANAVQASYAESVLDPVVIQSEPGQLLSADHSMLTVRHLSNRAIEGVRVQ